MTMLFLVCAVFGGTIMVCQLVMTVLGLGGHDLAHDVAHDVGHDMAHGHSDHSGDTNWLFSVLSFRTVVAAVTFFGIGGMATQELETVTRLGVALACGAAALFTVHYLLRLLARMNSDGTLRIENALGARGTVYIPIAGNRQAVGKVQLEMQNRIVELSAITPEKDELPTGRKVVVTALVSHDTVEVEPLREPEAVRT